MGRFFIILIQISVAVSTQVNASEVVQCDLLAGVYKITDLSINNQSQNLTDYESFISIEAIKGATVPLTASLISSNRSGDVRAQMYSRSNFTLENARIMDQEHTIPNRLFVYQETRCTDSGFSVETSYVPFFKSQSTAEYPIGQVKRFIKQFDTDTLLVTLVTSDSQIESMYKRVQENELSYLKVLKIIELQNQDDQQPLVN